MKRRNVLKGLVGVLGGAVAAKAGFAKDIGKTAVGGSVPSGGNLSSSASAAEQAGKVVRYGGDGACVSYPIPCGMAPKMILIKRSDGSDSSWKVYHDGTADPSSGLTGAI